MSKYSKKLIEAAEQYGKPLYLLMAGFEERDAHILAERYEEQMELWKNEGKADKDSPLELIKQGYRSR